MDELASKVYLKHGVPHINGNHLKLISREFNLYELLGLIKNNNPNYNQIIDVCYIMLGFTKEPDIKMVWLVENELREVNKEHNTSLVELGKKHNKNEYDDFFHYKCRAEVIHDIMYVISKIGDYDLHFCQNKITPYFNLGSEWEFHYGWSINAGIHTNRCTRSTLR